MENYEENYFMRIQDLINEDSSTTASKVSWMREEEILGVKVCVHFDNDIYYITDLKNRYVGIADSLEDAKLHFANDLGCTMAEKEFKKKLKKVMKW